MRQKKMAMTPCQQIITSSSFFRLLVDLEQFKTWISDECLTFAKGKAKLNNL